MAKNNYKKYTAGKHGVIKIISEQTKWVGKKGKIQGKNKKEKKMRQLVCLHHKVNGKGKVHSELTGMKEDKNVYRCRMCGAQIPVNVMGEKEIKKIYEPIEIQQQQLKYAAVKLGLNEKYTREIIECTIAIQKSKKILLGVSGILKKDQLAKSKKKKKKTGNNTYGSWRI